MVQQYTKQDKTYIWITEYERIEHELPYDEFSWKLDGVGMDGFHGFGSEKSRDYCGKFLLINSQLMTEISLCISLGHFSNQGLKWVINSGSNILPLPKFLITSDLEVSYVFSSQIEIDPEDDSVVNIDSVGFLYPIQSQNWFGIVTVENDQQLSLISFSRNRDIKISVGDFLYCPEYDCALGKIKAMKDFSYLA